MTRVTWVGISRRSSMPVTRGYRERISTSGIHSAIWDDGADTSRCLPTAPISNWRATSRRPSPAYSEDRELGIFFQPQAAFGGRDVELSRTEQARRTTHVRTRCFEYFDPVTKLDLSFAFQFSRRLSLVASINNVFNTPATLVWYGSQTPNYARQRRTEEFGAGTFPRNQGDVLKRVVFKSRQPIKRRSAARFRSSVYPWAEPVRVSVT